jgi:hypothetical protein
VAQLDEPGDGHISAPSVKIMIHAVAPVAPAFLVMATRIGAEENTARFQSGAAAGWPLAAWAQQPIGRTGKMARVGVLMPGPAAHSVEHADRPRSQASYERNPGHRSSHGRSRWRPVGRQLRAAGR